MQMHCTYAKQGLNCHGATVQSLLLHGLASCTCPFWAQFTFLSTSGKLYFLAQLCERGSNSPSAAVLPTTFHTRSGDAVDPTGKELS